jgi:subtilisin family serine protease
MSSTVRTGRRHRVRIAVVTAAVMILSAVTVGLAHAGLSDASSPAAGLYIVQFEAPPAAGYAGGVTGIAATKPAMGDRLDSRTKQYEEYRKHLRAQRANSLRTVQVDSRKVVAEYTAAFNGVAVTLTAAEVVKLRTAPGVRQVSKQRILRTRTADTPTFLGMSGSGGAWARQFGDQKRAGEGVIVGVIDTGIRPESPSFAALPEPRPDADVIAAKWHGECVAGEQAQVACNNKLIGARWYNFGGVDSPKIVDGEHRSPRDVKGHGSHTAGTAAGNVVVDASVGPNPVGTISGMAPAARIAAYKVCWAAPAGALAGGGCGEAEILRAIDDAVTDGVDVINYSIGPARQEPAADPVNVAFYHAAAAGVFVAAAAGNDGPGTVSNVAPWMATVAAGSHDRAFSKSVTLGNGTTYTGAGVGTALPSAPLVDSPSVAAGGEAGAEAEICAPGSLDPAKTQGKVVLCRQFALSSADMSLTVKQAGGVGMIMYDRGAEAVTAEYSQVPSIHLGSDDADAVKAYIAASGAAATAAMSAGVRQVVRAPRVASFSSSGPVGTARGDLLKPDITAPGVEIIAAVTPDRHDGKEFEKYSGTSMASPHIAGLAALLKGRFPHWTPAAVKSALMTTASPTDQTGAPIQRVQSGGAVPATPLDYGAGHVRPGPAFDPGFVYDSGPLEWAQFVCGVGEAWLIGEQSENGCRGVIDPVDPSDLNYPSIAVGDLAGTQTITRTVTNTTNQSSVYFANVKAPPGVKVTVTPSALTVLPRRSATFRVEITRTTAALDQYVFGSLTWADARGHSVRSPIAVRPVRLAAPEVLRPSGASGSAPLGLRASFAGTLTAKPYGLVGADVTTKTLVGELPEFDQNNPTAGPAVAKVDVTLPAGGKLARFAVYGADHAPGAAIAMYVYRGGTLVSAWQPFASGDQQVTVTDPGAYSIYVVKLNEGSLDLKLNSFVVGPEPAGNLTVTPASQPVTPGQPVTLTAAWSGLTPATRYLGVIEYGEGANPRGLTVVTVDR